MVDESSAPPPPANESIDPENNTRLGAKPESGQASSEADGERGFVCECEARMRSACKGEPFYEEHEGKRYCILHCSQKEKGAAFTQAIQRKIDKGDFDFKGVWFPEEADFRGITFTGDVSFFNALFSGTARFARATFSANADFRKATFRQDVDFSSGTFEGDTDFGLAFFHRCAHFQHASFGNSLTFSRYSNDLTFTEWTLKAKGPWRTQRLISF